MDMEDCASTPSHGKGKNVHYSYTVFVCVCVCFPDKSHQYIVIPLVINSVKSAAVKNTLIS